MIQLSRQLKLSPDTTAAIVQQNIHNQAMLPLITQKQLLAQADLCLTSPEQTEFFIKYVFQRVREPYKQEIKLLKQYLQDGKNANLKQLAQLLISHQYQKGQLSVNNLLAEVEKCMLEDNLKEKVAILKSQAPKNVQPCFGLIEVLQSSNENSRWTSREYRQQLFLWIQKGLSAAEELKDEKEYYLNIISRLIWQTIKEDKDVVHLVLLLHELLDHFQSYLVVITKNIHQLESKSQQIPSLFLSKALFSSFLSLFKTQVYFQVEKQEHLLTLLQVAKDFYNALSSQLTPCELGWISIFALDKLAQGQHFQKQLHICSSVLREAWFFEAEIVTECFCFVVSRFVQQVAISENISRLESILTILTPKQLKYMILKLNSILSEDKKSQIIEASLKANTKALRACAYHFLIDMRTLSNQSTATELGQALLAQYGDLIEKVEQSRYNSFESEMNHFLEHQFYLINSEISSMNFFRKARLMDLLQFYKHLIVEDYFAEQFWLNEQKIIVFSINNSHPDELLEIFTAFMGQQKIYNLSCAMLATSILSSYPDSVLRCDLQQMTQLLSRCLHVLDEDSIPSNLTIALEFVAVWVKQQINPHSHGQIESVLISSNVVKMIKKVKYCRLHFLVESVMLDLLKKGNKMEEMFNYKETLPFLDRTGAGIRPTTRFNRYFSNIQQLYSQYSIHRPTNFALRQLREKDVLKKMICFGFCLGSLREQILGIKDSFQFGAPLYKEEIVSLTYLAHSPEDNYYFKNHFINFMQMEYAKIIAKTAAATANLSLLNQIQSISIQLLEAVLIADTLCHSKIFYQALLQSQLAYSLLRKDLLPHFSIEQLSAIIELCLRIIKKQNYPLVRQQIEVILCRTYLTLNLKKAGSLARQQLIDTLKINVNVGIPIILTLGYELLHYCKSPELYSIQDDEENIIRIHEVLVKFISCHTAYLRAICQYYLHSYIQLNPQKDPFLLNISHFWQEDRDSQKILANVAMVVEGFKNAVEEQQDFVGFQRVEEYPSDRVKFQIYRSCGEFYCEEILGQVRKQETLEQQLFEGYRQAAVERFEEVRNNYIELLQKIMESPSGGTTKSNMKNKGGQKTVKDVVAKSAKKGGKQGKKKANKMEEKQQAQLLVVAKNSSPFSELSNRLQFYSKIEDNSVWLRDNLDPTVIVIATLLEKVHNFGHILRTLHNHNAMIVVPSEIPLLHPECKQLVPTSSDVQIVQIKQRDLHKFIILMKSLGYPLVALEQCSRSVPIESAVFPQKFMLLLGNERLGAPGWLLGQGDLLVQIPQVGKIRSLNVHVSMVLCLWQFLIQAS